MFSKRSHVDREPNRLSSRLNELRQTGKPIVDLTLSNPTEAGLPFENERILAALSDTRSLAYAPEALGLPRARAAVAAYYRTANLEIDPANIVLTASTSEAYA